MTYIENIFICIAIPLVLSLFFIQGKARFYTAFIVIGIIVCLLSAYVSSFFMEHYHTNAMITAIEITPVCEEIMKLLPLLFYLLVFEPKQQDIIPAAIAIAVGFATFENVCYLTENGAESFFFMLTRGISAGALHILCGIALGYGLAYVYRKGLSAFTGTFGLLGACICFHAIYNLLISATQKSWQHMGYFFPSAMILCLFLIKCIAEKKKKDAPLRQENKKI